MLAQQLVQRWEQGWAGAQACDWSMCSAQRLTQPRYGTFHASLCFPSPSSSLSSGHPNSQGPTMTGGVGDII